MLYLLCGMLTRQADMGGRFRAGAAQAARVAMQIAGFVNIFFDVLGTVAATRDEQ
jgi:hypothetical protein